MQKRAAFSLVEVTLAIGIIAFALIAILGLVPVGMTSSKEAIDATRTSLIAQDVQNRIKSALTGAMFTGTGDVVLPAWFYNREGVFVDVSTTGYDSVIFRAQAIIHGTWNSVPANVDATVLRPATFEIGWPINPTTYAAVGTNRASFTFYVRRP